MAGTAVDGDKLITALIKQGVEASIKTVDPDGGYDA